MYLIIAGGSSPEQPCRPSRDPLVRVWSAPAAGSSGPVTEHNDTGQALAFYYETDFQKIRCDIEAGQAGRVCISPDGRYLGGTSGVAYFPFLV